MKIKFKLKRGFFKSLNRIDMAYMAGYLDGNGSIITQIVKSKNYKFGFAIKISIVFYEKADHHWFLEQMHKFFEYGQLRKRKDGVSEYVITRTKPVKKILEYLKEFLVKKRKLVDLVLKIIEERDKVDDMYSFIEVCKLVDETRLMTKTKVRKITSDDVIANLDIFK